MNHVCDSASTKLSTVDSETLAERLVPVLVRATAWPEPRVVNLQRLTGGSSRETWSLDAVDQRGQCYPLILQLKRSLIADQWIDTATEAQLLSAAHAANVPTPELIACSSASEELGLPFLLLERIDGETIPQRILRQEQFAPARAQLARQYGDALARIQQIRPADVPDVKHQDPLMHWQQTLDRIGRPAPALELGLRWLTSNRPLAGPPVIVQGDFRNGNGIVDPNLGLRAVIDWELSHLGDPLEDLGWFCIRAWRFGAPLPVGGFGNYDDIIASYESVAGYVVNRAALRWWQIMGTVRWAVICLMQGATHWQGHRRSLELAAVGRRVAEAEFDLMLLLP